MVATIQAKRHAAKIARRLGRQYPDAKCELEHETPFQLLVATILSAQCTDARVNLVTRELFRKCPRAEDLARLPIRRLEKAIASTGFFRNKAKSIKGCSTALVEQYDGEVPRDIERLVELPGVGRKTANVVLGTAFGLATGVVVDTHVARITRRLGMTKQTDPVKIERDLMDQLPRKVWVDYAHRLIHHGRQVCTAGKPSCETCCLVDLCPRLGVVA
jgi:endonuclease-3